MTYKVPEGWKEVKLGDVILVNPRESLDKVNKYKKISMGDVKEHTKKISSYKLERYNGGAKFRNGDTLFARITPCLENGKISHVDILEENEIAFGSTEFLVLREKENITLNDYIYYLVKSPEIVDTSIKSMVGSSGRQRVQNDVFKNITFNLPPLQEQKAIADTLSALDDKIELNNKINQNLEAQAQAIFKHWFIDFEFPDKNGNPYKSSGGEMVESELGMIPKGWEVGELGNSKLGKLITSGIEDYNGQKIYLATADVSETKIINNDTLITIKDRPSRANMKPRSNTIWFAKMKNSRKLILVDKLDHVLQDNYIFSTGFAGIQCTELSIYYLWTYIQSKLFDIKKNSLCTGTTMQAINNENINKIKVLIPEKTILEKFNKIVGPMYQIIINIREQNIRLAELRDTLLPKLISGEIRIPLDE